VQFIALMVVAEANSKIALKSKVALIRIILTDV
jgi:hypothetical protein